MADAPAPDDRAAAAPDALAIVRRLHQHRAWLNDQLRTVAATLSDDQLRQPFEMGQGSLLATLSHMYAAEFVWIETLSGNRETPSPASITFDRLEELLAVWPILERRWRRYLDRLTPAVLSQPVSKLVSSGPLAGQVLVTVTSDVLLHVATHAHYTSAQAMNMLRHLGVPPEHLPHPQLITLARRETQDADR